MKIAIYIEDGLSQLVLTPQTKYEEAIIKTIRRGDQNVTISSGSFYEARMNDDSYIKKSEYSDDESLIIVTKLDLK